MKKEKYSDEVLEWTHFVVYSVNKITKPSFYWQVFLKGVYYSYQTANDRNSWLMDFQLNKLQIAENPVYFQKKIASFPLFPRL